MSARELQEVIDRLEGLIARLESLVENTKDRHEHEYRRMLQETAAVLLATKGSFHSRRLKQLRERIEAFLK